MSIEAHIKVTELWACEPTHDGSLFDEGRSDALSEAATVLLHASDPRMLLLTLLAQSEVLQERVDAVMLDYYSGRHSGLLSALRLSDKYGASDN